MDKMNYCAIMFARGIENPFQEAAVKKLVEEETKKGNIVSNIVVDGGSINYSHSQNIELIIDWTKNTITQTEGSSSN